MKFRRILAALLGALMITSVMSFTANVSAADGDIIFQSAYPSKFSAERGKTSVHMYDAENDIVFSRMTPNFDLTGACYINISSQTVVPTAEQIANDSIYVVFYVRTNMALDENDKPSLNLYNAYWGPDAINQEGTCSLVTGNENFIEQVGNDWGTMCFKLNTTKTISGTEYSINKWTQFACFAVGTADTNPIADWTAKAPEGEIPNMDCAGYAVVSSLEAAEAYDFTESAKAPQITLTFEIGNDEEAITEEVTSGAWDTAGYVEFPEITAPEGMVFAGWYNGDTKIENTETLAVPTANTTYTAQWYTSNLSLDSLMINGTTASTYGVTDINAEEIVVNLPYGWEELEALGVMPAIEPVADSLVTAAYTAPASLSESGKITLTSGEFTKEVTVKFTIGANPGNKVGNKLSSAVTGAATVDGTSYTGKRGLVPVNGTFHELDSYELTPVYAGSANDDPVNTSYTSERSTIVEGSGTFGAYNFESYIGYRVLVYYDTGDGEFDKPIAKTPVVKHYTDSSSGTFSTALPIMELVGNGYKGDRWEYMYFEKPESAKTVYGKAHHPIFPLLGDGTKGKDFVNDKIYVAEVMLLAESEPYKQYRPVDLTVVDIANGKPGTISGLSDDMEMLVGDTWTAITSVVGYENGVLSVTESDTYSFRYAADGIYIASEATEVFVDTDEVGVTVKVIFDNGDADEEYTLTAKGQSATYTGTVNVPEGYLFKGWKNAQGEIVTTTNTYTASEYVASEIIVLTPVVEKDTSKPYYFTKGVYNEYLNTYDVTVYIANGKYTLGTLGGQFDKAALTYKGYTLGELVGNDLGDTPDIVKDSMYTGSDDTFVILWNAKKDAIDATSADVEIITFHFEVADKAAFEAKFGTDTPAVVPFIPEKNYEKHFEKGYYQVVKAPEAGGNEFAIDYIDVTFGQHIDEYAPTVFADVTFKVNPKSKNGATNANITYLAYSLAGAEEWTFVALEEVGNEDEIEEVISETFMIGSSYDIRILKNGYIGYTADAVKITEGHTFDVELLGGDIKGSSTGTDADAVDFGDFGDGVVDLSDFVRVIRAFDEQSDDTFRATVDIDESGSVTVSDLAIIKANYTAE